MLSERAILSGEHRAWLLAALEIQPNGFDPVDAIRSELTLCDNAGCPTASWYFWTRTRREIALAPFGLGQRVKTIFAPYLDADLFDFLTALPDWMLLEKTLHDDVIAAAYPALASIPYVPKQVPPKRRLRERLRLRLDREIGEARLFGHGHRRLIPRVSHRGLASWIAGLAHASGATTQDEAPAETGYTSAN
jgi:hypothetical protein